MADYHVYTDKTILDWGKYKGVALANIPADYLLFLYFDLEDGLKHIPLKNYIEDNIDVLKAQSTKYKKR
jgi:hypothetical protein